MSRMGSIDCNSFEDRIHQLLDDRLTLTGDDLLMAHAARCANCEKILQDYESVNDSVKMLPAELTQILADAETKRADKTLVSSRLMLLASLAATIVISLNIFHAFDSQPDAQPLAEFSPVVPIATQPPLSITTAVTKNQPTPEIQLLTEPQRITPETSPFSPEFSLVSSMPNINLPTVPTWNDISKSLDPLEPVLTYSSKIPAVRPVHCSLNAGINLLKRSFNKSERKPDLGFWIDPNMLAAV